MTEKKQTFKDRVRDHMKAIMDHVHEVHKELDSHGEPAAVKAQSEPPPEGPVGA